MEKRVLLVEDDQDLGYLLSLAIESLGYQTALATSGKEALRIAREWAPTVAFLDILLPDLDGFQIAEELRAMEETKDTVLIGLTGWAGSVGEDYAETAGLDYYMHKPPDIDIIERLLRAAFSEAA